MDYHGGDDMRLFGAVLLWRQHAAAGVAAFVADVVYGDSFFRGAVSKPVLSTKPVGPLWEILILPHTFFPCQFLPSVGSDQAFIHCVGRYGADQRDYAVFLGISAFQEPAG